MRRASPMPMALAIMLAALSSAAPGRAAEHSSGAASARKSISPQAK